ncbi:MAG TPA: hypothetical protein VE397_21000 [Stellaceae bacterium]|nr:hypothetical protein [Stellaceae bacterium]
MRDKVRSLVAAAALLGSIGAAYAKQPVDLTDAQLDEATAGVGLGGLIAIPFALAWPGGINTNTGFQSSVLSTTGSLNGVGVLQSSQNINVNQLQLNNVTILAPTGF